MGQILGLGITHYLNLAARVNMSWRMQTALEDAALPERLRAVENWHPIMREQWGNDRGQVHSDQHRRDLIDQFRKARAELDAFNPDFVLIWEELGRKQPDESAFLESWITNSDKVFAVFRPK